ncbi:unnamed protein product [Rangifer tarandus platyrhynchus]|uniref:Uncharacterized protein n=2 Tax=Rangifer tarandus platyrhynchus TaxID=3082113 RepID=A0ABN8YQY4_RANTA|nr:unnamed protein product [Rangifer tarandus platyrhynchus]CAI9700500.1 unnamed protein product [Rangifer tarandus platyrhynchus]
MPLHSTDALSSKSALPWMAYSSEQSVHGTHSALFSQRRWVSPSPGWPGEDGSNVDPAVPVLEHSAQPTAGACKDLRLAKPNPQPQNHPTRRLQMPWEPK